MESMYVASAEGAARWRPDGRIRLLLHVVALVLEIDLMHHKKIPCDVWQFQANLIMFHVAWRPRMT